jgi:hypothetical protein
VTQLFFSYNPRLVPSGTTPWAIINSVLPEHIDTARSVWSAKIHFAYAGHAFQYLVPKKRKGPFTLLSKHSSNLNGFFETQRHRETQRLYCYFTLSVSLCLCVSKSLRYIYILILAAKLLGGSKRFALYLLCCFCFYQVEKIRSLCPNVL